MPKPDPSTFDLAADLAWCKSHKPELLAQYRGKFILVFNQQVLAAAKTEKKLLKRARALGFVGCDPFLVMSVAVRKELPTPLEV